MRTSKQAQRVAAAEPSAPLVLVADDFEDTREIYGEYLRHQGYRVEFAADGKEALDKVQSLKPSVVIMDLALPVVDGWEATRAIKSNPAARSTCVIVVTGHSTATELRRAEDAGADEVHVKPFLPSDLLRAVRRC